METTRLSSKGRVIIPKGFRASHHWNPGLELQVIDAGEGILLKPRTPFEKTSLKDVAGCLKREDHESVSPVEINEAIRKGIQKDWRVRA